MACTLSNKCAKNLSKRAVLLQLIIKNVVTCFFWNTVYMYIGFTVPIDTFGNDFMGHCTEGQRSVNKVKAQSHQAQLTKR